MLPVQQLMRLRRGHIFDFQHGVMILRPQESIQPVARARGFTGETPVPLKFSNKKKAGPRWHGPAFEQD